RPLLPAVALDRGRRLLRRPAGDLREPLDRPVRPLRDPPPPARLAARGARLDHEPRPARARVRRPQLRVARGHRAAARAEGGAVMVGGVDTRAVPIAELRSDVALVTQRPVLFSVPLRDNLLAGREDAAWSEVLAACSAAGVDAFAEGLPDGYDTLIGERGVN